MKAVRTKMWADIRRRRLQSIVIALVILLSSAAATLALSLLVESDAPYDHAFAQANGPHLTLTFDAVRVTTAQLLATAHAHGVTAKAGPWPRVVVDAFANPGAGGPVGAKGGGTQIDRLSIMGRDRPDTTVDRLTVEGGRWAQRAGEIVLTQRWADHIQLGVGDRITVVEGATRSTFVIVGVASSISPEADAWVVPQQATVLAAQGAPLAYQMMYRVNPANTAADLRAATQAISAHLAPGVVQDARNYLDVKLNADRTTAVMIPFLLAFSVFALLAAAFIIANVVGGVVIASYREIGVMKSVGFAPGQAMLVLLGQILVPALGGLLVGIPLGTLGSQPFLQQTAHALGLPAPFTAAIPVDLLVLAAVVAVALLAAVVPAWRAGRLSAVAAITMGSAPTSGRASGPGGHRLSRLPLPRAVSLGLGDALARPLRSAMTTGAILVGVATVVFALSLRLSLGQVAAHLIRDGYVQVEVRRPAAGNVSKGPAPGGQAPQQLAEPLVSDGQVIALLRANPDTARFVAEGQGEAVVPGIAEPIPYFGYRGDSSWIGYALIAGRWFAAPGEVVAPTNLLSQAHLHIGDTMTARIDGKAVRLRLVGEILDQTGDDLLLRGTWTTLAAADPRAEPLDYEVGLRAGVNPRAYADGLRSQAPGVLDIRETEHSGTNTTFILLESVITALALALTVIAVAGVFNTVVLSTREKARDVAILKAVGMAPGQVVAMVVASVAMLGLVAGALGIPVGLTLHRQILLFMGHIASGTGMPSTFFDLIGHAVLPLLALAGVAVAALGAWIPARWAASSGVADVLQAE